LLEEAGVRRGKRLWRSVFQPKKGAMSWKILSENEASAHVPVFPERGVRVELIMSRDVPKSDNIARGLKEKRTYINNS
jgi:hypothetical protein